MGKILAEIASQLEEPFPVECIELLPKGKIEKDGKTLCMGLPYADVRVYEDRLNTLVPGEWSTPPPTAIVAGQKLIVYVTVIVCGVPHSDVGEAFLVSESGNQSENAATESWAQAFKRACSQFGLGRYLYDLEKAWVPYNKQRRQIDLDGPAIARTVSGMYKKVGLGVDANKNGGAQPKRVVEAQKPVISQDIKDRLNDLFPEAKALNLFEISKNDQETLSNFFKLISTLTSERVIDPAQVTMKHLGILASHIQQVLEARQQQPAEAVA